MSDTSDARGVVLAYVQSVQRSDWTAVCSTLDRDALAGEQSSVTKCARGFPSILNLGTKFLGILRDGQAAILKMHVQLLGNHRANVFVLWHVTPWNRDVIQRLPLCREYDRSQHGQYRVGSDVGWATRWPS